MLAVRAHPGITAKELARKLKYTRPASIYKLLTELELRELLCGQVLRTNNIRDGMTPTRYSLTLEGVRHAALYQRLFELEEAKSRRVRRSA